MSLNPDSPLGKILTKLLDLLVLQLYFILTSIPVVTIGAGLTAMFSVCRKMHTDAVTSVTKTYFTEFRASFKKSTVAWLILGFAAALLAMSASYYYHMAGIFRLVPLVIACLGLVLAYIEFLYVFPLSAWFDNSLKAHFRNAPVLALLHFKTTLLTTLLYAFVFLLVVPLLPITALIAFSGSAFYASMLMGKVFAQYDPAAALDSEAPDEGDDED